MSETQKLIERLKASRSPEIPKTFFEKHKENTIIFLSQFLRGSIWAWNHSLGPVYSKLSWLGAILFNFYKKMWVKFVYNDDGSFSTPRAGIAVIWTLLCFYFFVNAAGLAFNTVNYFLTVKHDEVVYMTNSQEIDAEENTHSAQGCTTLPCDDESSIYFRIEPSAFNIIQSLLTRGKLFYPDYVAAAIPPGVSKCTITSYGVRWKFLMRGWDVYPHIIHASCSPLPK